MSDPRDYIRGGRRCAIRRAEFPDNWWVSYSPRNDSDLSEGEWEDSEGEWEDWVELARRILAADEEWRNAEALAGLENENV